MKQCTPLTELVEGQKVRVGNKTGHVVSSEKHNAIPSGFIIVHKILLTAKETRLNYKHVKTENINEAWQGNYSHLYY